MCGCDRCARGEGIAAGRLRRQHVDARRRDGDVAAAIGVGEDAVIGIGRRHRDDAGIGPRIERRGAAAAIAGRGDCDHPALLRPGECLGQQAVLRTGEAEIDHLGALLDDPFQRRQDLEGLAVGGGRLRAAEGAGDDQPGGRGDALQLAMRDDGGRHRGTMRMRGRLTVHGVEIGEDRAADLRMLHVHAGIDHPDPDATPQREFARLAKAQLVDDILRRQHPAHHGAAARGRGRLAQPQAGHLAVAGIRGGGRRIGSAARPAGLERRALLKLEQEVRLRTGDAAVVAHLGQHGTQVPSGFELGADDRDPGELEALAGNQRRAIAAQHDIGLRVRRQLEQHLVGHEPGLVERRHDAALLARLHPQARRHVYRAVGRAAGRGLLRGRRRDGAPVMAGGAGRRGRLRHDETRHQHEAAGQEPGTDEAAHR
ncbi:hypothetical protein BTHI11S_03555 [Bosea thiooxidans]